MDGASSNDSGHTSGDQFLPRRNDVIHAYGHSHCGLTLGPTTGRLVADMVDERAPTINLTPFSVSRLS